MQLLGIDEREGVLEVHLMDGMEVEACLEAQKSGIALGVLIGEIAFFHDGIDALGEDVVLDAVGKECGLERDVP